MTCPSLSRLDSVQVALSRIGIVPLVSEIFVLASSYHYGIQEAHVFFLKTSDPSFKGKMTQVKGSYICNEQGKYTGIPDSI